MVFFYFLQLVALRCISWNSFSFFFAGYLPEGEGWKYICEGRTAWDGDRPINSNGGRTSFGHAHAASGLADFYEACKQIWQECGDRNVKFKPKTAFLRGYGGAQNVASIIIKEYEGGEE